MLAKISSLILTLVLIVNGITAANLDNYNILEELSGVDLANDFENTTIETSDPDQFRYVPVEKKGCFNFWVKASNEAHVSLSNAAQYINPKVKIVIGGWNNAESAIVLNDGVNSPPIKTNTPGILNSAEYRGFWIRWSQNGDILVGKMNEIFPFLVYKHSEQWYPINFIGVTCGRTFRGSWIIKEKPSCPY